MKATDNKILCPVCNMPFSREWLSTHITREAQNEAKSNLQTVKKHAMWKRSQLLKE